MGRSPVSIAAAAAMECALEIKRSCNEGNGKLGFYNVLANGCMGLAVTHSPNFQF